MVLLVGARIDCCHTHTGLYGVTDTGMKAFSAALGFSSTITTVILSCKSEVVGVVFVWVDPCVGVHAGAFGRRVDLVVCGVVCLCDKCLTSGR